MRYLIILIATILASCQSNDQQSHAHDEQGNHMVDNVERPSLNKTIWTDKTEVFVEFPVFVVGYTSRLAAHFTILEKHQPVREGNLTVSLIKNGKGIQQTLESPSSPGIFNPSLRPTDAGNYQLVFKLEAPSISDIIVVKDVVVFASIEEAIEASSQEKEDNNAIAFLKEQAWKIEFQTSPAVKGEIYDILSTSGVWKVPSSDYQILVATTSGIVTFNKIITEGAGVKKGEDLMLVSSSRLTSENLDSEIHKSKSKYDQAQSEYSRKKQLYDSKIISKAEFELVERNYQVAKSTYETLNAGYTLNGKRVIAPFDGYVNSISVNNGEFVEQGDPLFIVSKQQSSILETQVSSSYSSQIQHIHDVYYQPKIGSWSSLNKTGGKILSVGKGVQSNKPQLSVNAQVNEVVEMPEGSFTEVQLAIGEPIEAIKIPVSALLEDYGNYSVVVQISGESFEIRPITIGKRNGSEVEVKNGMKIGEVVVTEGAYQVKMASMSNQAPAHGHDH